ncbi:MAG: sigma 54-interacting transcriptional regulator [Candidatus Polarisedimenticolia bacterium]
MTWLGVSIGSLPVFAIPLHGGTMRLGRSLDNDIVLTLPEIADVHAELSLSNGRAVLTALHGETILVKGKAVPRAEIPPGSSAGLGGYRLHVHDTPGDPWSGKAGSVSTGTQTLDDDEPSPAGSPGAAGPVRVVRVVSGKDAGMTVPLDRQVFVIGRAPDCEMVLHDETVSWRHVSLEKTDGGLRVRDLGSRNGTFVGGQRIEAAFTQTGARIRAGRTTLELRGDADRQVVPGSGSGLAEMIGRSAAMRGVYDAIQKAAQSRVPVLLCGETGTGKDLAARALHASGPRSRGPLVPLNCAAIPPDMLEDELFGHARGAFTGAVTDRVGAFDLANQGTIFLDEMGELPLALQPKLLKVLDDGRIPRLGGGISRSDFRVVAATNRDLSEEVGQGRFRKDLYFRLAVLQIRLPRLAEHLEDLPDLVHLFLEQAEERTGVAGSCETRFTEEALAILKDHTWPGNVRELRNVIESAVVRSPGGVVEGAAVRELLAASSIQEPEVRRRAASLQEVKIEAIRNALVDYPTKREAARRLGIAESTLHDLIRKHHLEDVGQKS